MPTLESIIKQKLDRLETVPKHLISGVEKSQKKIFSELLELLEGLEREGGKILVTESNLLKSQAIADRLKQVVFQTEYLESVKQFAGEFDTQAKITNQYFSKAFKDVFKETDLYKNVLKQTQKNAIELLSEAGVNQEFINPMKDILNTSVTTGADFIDTVKSLREFVEGNEETAGTLTRYVKQVANDSFAFSDRQYTKVISEDIEAEWFLYSGGIIEDSREFCVERNGKYFHKNEVAEWGNIKAWQGRAKGTNESTIWTFAGGYNCQHSILPVSVFSVPQEVIDRNIENGNYEPEAEPEKE